MEENTEKSKTQESIPSTKVERAARFVKTGFKVGGNYIKHYAKKIVDPSTSVNELHAANADDIYKTLSQLKGSALKVAQMLSMDKNILPTEYSQKFTQAQYSAPPLSYPLVVKTFQKAFGKSPSEVFDTFSQNSIAAASIGQVHKASIGNEIFAVKVQYPGVAESIKSDLKMVKPFAATILQINQKELDHYVEEVETMLLSETDYALELRRSIELSEACQHIEGVFFPKYYPQYSSDRILTMQWIEGKHLDEFLKTNPSQEIRNKIGQTLWDFYDHQFHNLKTIHADPHPGNFLFQPDGKVGIIDFGCVKVVDPDFYEKYFRLLSPDILEKPTELSELLHSFNFLQPNDSQEEKNELMGVFTEMVRLLGRPFYSGEFDFAGEQYFLEVAAFGQEMAKNKTLRDSKKPRGDKRALYVNRTFFGLYSILNQIGAKISTNSIWYQRKQ
jgi:predicted unusual protein kinase regulating ubiquinone biosynthesis (AarF/ABC1/UbiB family)